MLPETIDIRITGRCNLECSQCFGTKINRDIESDKLICLINTLPRYNVKNVVITGGEPLLVKELNGVLKSLKDNGLKVVLSTNGILLLNHIESIYKYIDWISIPLDGSTSEVNSLMRRDSLHFKKSLDAIEIIKKNYPSMKIKIGTVFHEGNKNDILNICQLLKNKKYTPNTWKIYELVNTTDCHPCFTCNKQEFYKLKNSLNKIRNTVSFNIEYLGADERNGKYLFLEPNGDAIIIHNSQQICVGNFYTNLNDLLNLHKEFVDYTKLNGNFKSTYI